MGRLFSVLLLSAMLAHVPAYAHQEYVQPVFFSLLFPQLVPPCLLGGGEVTL